MDDIFQQLETRIRAMIQKYDHLLHITEDLKKNKIFLAREKERVLAKQKSIVIQIENMVTRLKSIEGLQ